MKAALGFALVFGEHPVFGFGGLAVMIELPSQEPMLQAVGQGIQAFARVELGIGWCFTQMIGENGYLGPIILEASRHFESKMKLVDAVAPYTLSPDHLTRWRTLSNRARRRANVRHKLAHWTVGYFPLPDSNGANAKDVRVKLGPTVLSLEWIPILHGLPNAATPLSLSEVRSFRDGCHELARDLTDFSVLLMRKRLGQEAANVGSGEVGDEK